jgi:hypothetical protein
MRGRMSAARSYAKPVEVGEPMVGGTVNEVVESRHPQFKAGDIVLGYAGWQDYAVSNRFLAAACALHHLHDDRAGAAHAHQLRKPNRNDSASGRLLQCVIHRNTACPLPRPPCRRFSIG